MNMFLRYASALVGLTAPLAAQTASGAFVAYMHIPNLPGEVTEENFEQWIEVSKVEWNAKRTISSLGAGGSRPVSPPSISEITITKNLDKTSPGLFLRAVGVGNQSGIMVRIAFVNTTYPNKPVYYEIELDDALVSSQSNSTSIGVARPQESITLNFTKITLKYTEIDTTGQAQGDTLSFYDLITGQGG